MAQLEGIERQWEAKKHSLAEELERVEKLLANAYDRYVCMCEQLMHHMYWSNGRVSHHTRHISVNTSCAGRWGLPHQLCWAVGTASPAMLGCGDCLTRDGDWPHQLCWAVGTASPAMLGAGDCLTSYAGGWGLPHQGWGLASPAMLGGGDCYPMYQHKQTVIRTVYTCNEGNCTLELRKLVATHPCSTTCDVYDCL